MRDSYKKDKKHKNKPQKRTILHCTRWRKPDSLDVLDGDRDYNKHIGKM